MKQADKQGQKNKIGAIGEKITENYLKKRHFKILATNYLKKWGEIDIVAHGTDQKIHFIEVKTISHGTKNDLETAVAERAWRPEENVTHEKLRKLHRTIESWFGDNQQYSDYDWQIDIAAVRVVLHEKYAAVKYIDNVII